MKKYKIIHDNANNFFCIPVRCDKKSQIQTHAIFMPNVEIMLQNVSANCRQSLRYLIKYCILPTEFEWTLYVPLCII